MQQSLLQLKQCIAETGHKLDSSLAVAGFDGFVDEMMSVVDERQSLESFRPMPSISSFGEWVSHAAGRSSLKEIVVHRFDAGGCAVNLGDGLLHFGLDLDCYATLGAPVAQAFHDFAGRCRHYESWGEQPGRTLAMEFNDGKLMFASTSQLADFNVALVEQACADGRYEKSCAEANIIAITNWTLYPHMTDCWRYLQQNVYSKLSNNPWFFIDLVDPRSRSQADIIAMLDAIPAFEQNGKCVLGLNLNEANAVAKIFDIPAVEETAEAVAEQAAAIREKLGISQIVTHCVRLAAVADAAGTSTATGPYCEKTVKTVGAGDRFNAGYCSGLLLCSDGEQRLLFGNASSGYFVRNGHSANREQLVNFIQEWHDNLA